MKNSFTLDDLIFLAFNETLAEGQFPAAYRTEDRDLPIDWASLRKETKNVSPDQRIINNILHYSQALNVIKTRDAGTFHLLVN